MEIASSDNSDWLIDYSIVDDIPIAGNFDWPSQAAPAVNASSAASVTIDCSFGDSDGPKEVEAGSRKRLRSESCCVSGSKACREKLRRDRLNERFLELGSMLEPGRPPKTDKATILSDAVRMMEQLRTEAQKLKQSNEDLQEKIKELKRCLCRVWMTMCNLVAVYPCRLRRMSSVMRSRG
ncbi:transcription factor ILR3 [Citrus sinensis]|uniref:Transcription factor ILR3 n=1 Tax=Citrus sinensis TaxID=2711 RepID=A0ACB8N6M1_CITSI|nr:transcription factor ILR3 [Citrus sinensis]